MPALPMFVTLLEWLDLPYERFIVRSGSAIDAEISTQRVIDSGPFLREVLSETQIKHVRSGLEEIVRTLTA